jgi:chromosome segregation ATPase
LKTERAKLTSNCSLLSEKLATLRKQCEDIDVRRQQLASDASAEEKRFRERRAELEQKLTSIENDIKAASARLRELQSQAYELNNQIAEKKTEIERLGSQKAAELKALSDLEEKRKAVSQDYQTVSRDLTALRSRHDDVKRECKDFVAEANQTITTLGRKITDQKGELVTLGNAKSEVEKALAKCKETLDKINQEIAGKQSLFTLVSLLNDPKTPLKPKDALEPVASALKAAKDYVQNHSGEIPRSGELVAALDQAIRAVTEALRVASR